MYKANLVVVLLVLEKRRRLLPLSEQFCQILCAGVEQLYLFLVVNSEATLPRRSY